MARTTRTHGTLSSWWTRIVIGALLCAFCLLPRLIERHAKPMLRRGGTSAVAGDGEAGAPHSA